MIPINEYLIRFSGKIAIQPKDLELGKELDLNVKGTIVEIKHQDTQESTQDVMYIVKPTEVQVHD